MVIKVYSFVHSFIQQSVNTDYVPGTVLNAMSSCKHEQDIHMHCPLETHSLVGSSRSQRRHSWGEMEKALLQGVSTGTSPWAHWTRHIETSSRDGPAQDRGAESEPGSQTWTHALSLEGAQKDGRHKQQFGGKGRRWGKCPGTYLPLYLLPRDYSMKFWLPLNGGGEPEVSEIWWDMKYERMQNRICRLQSSSQFYLPFSSVTSHVFTQDGKYHQMETMSIISWGDLDCHFASGVRALPVCEGTDYPGKGHCSFCLVFWFPLWETSARP